MTNDLIEISLNRYRYHFRQLKWAEEARLKFRPGEDQRKVLMALALVDVSGLELSRSDARKVIDALPESVLWRIWVLYRGNLPPERYYSSGGLYTAPDQNKHRQSVQIEDEHEEAVSDQAMAEVARRFGPKGVEESEALSRRMFESAQREGKLIPAREDDDGD